MVRVASNSYCCFAGRASLKVEMLVLFETPAGYALFKVTNDDNHTHYPLLLLNSHLVDLKKRK